jgi:hypothetical protein
MSDNIPTIDAAAIRRCPNSDVNGTIIAKAYRDSVFIEWEADGAFMGLIERLPGKPPVFHKLCPACAGGHFVAIGTSPVLDEQPSRSVHAN